MHNWFDTWHGFYTSQEPPTVQHQTTTTSFLVSVDSRQLNAMNSAKLTCSFSACFLCLFILIATEKGLYRIPLAEWWWWKSSMVVSTQSHEFLLKMEKIYGQRRARVNEICRKYAETFSWNLTDQVLAQTLWYSTEHRLAYCPVNKVTIINEIPYKGELSHFFLLQT